MVKKLIVFLLVLIPFIGQLALLPFVNKIEPIIIGLPFLPFWLLLWIVLTPLCTWGIYKIQQAEGSDD